MLAVALAGLLAACSSSGDDASPATTSTTSPPAPTTTNAPTTTTAPTTTDPPPTTIDPAQPLAAQVEADFRETFRLTDLAFQDPADDAAVLAALEGYVESNRDLIEQRLAELRSNGQAARPNPDVEALVVVEKPAVLASSPADTAVLQVCHVDSWIVVEPGAGPGGSDVVVNPDLTSYRSTFVMVEVDARWRIRGSESLGEYPGESSCPAE